MSEKIILPKEILLPEIKKTMATELAPVFFESGVTDFIIEEVEWTKKGLIIHYSVPEKDTAKQDENSS